MSTAFVIEALDRRTPACAFWKQHGYAELKRGAMVISAATVMQLEFYLRSMRDLDAQQLQQIKIRQLLAIFRERRCIVPVHDAYVDYACNTLVHRFAFVDGAGREVPLGFSDKLVWATAIKGVHGSDLLLIDVEISNVHAFLRQHYGLRCYVPGTPLPSRAGAGA